MLDQTRTARENFENAAPVPAFNVVDRSAGWADHRANTIRNRVELMLKAEADGDTRAMLALADQAVGWIMQARVEMEKRAAELAEAVA
jgi:hypothetical protein